MQPHYKANLLDFFENLGSGPSSSVAVDGSWVSSEIASKVSVKIKAIQ